jgi:hypothetical protein
VLVSYHDHERSPLITLAAGVLSLAGAALGTLMRSALRDLQSASHAITELGLRRQRTGRHQGS